MNPNWPEANQLATVYKRGRGFELGTSGEQIQLAVMAELELGASELQIQRSNHSVTLPPPNSLNPLSPNSDKDQISPNNIHTLSRDKL